MDRSLGKILFIVGLISFLFFSAKSQVKKNTVQIYPRDTSFLESLMQEHFNEFNYYLNNRKSLEIQILYTQINRDSLNHPHFREYSFNLHPESYFYPASSIKLPLTALALEKLEGLEKYQINKSTTILIDSLAPKQSIEWVDSNSVNGKPSIGNYIRRILLVSDNDAYNRLYEFLGPDSINFSLRRKGFPSVRILQRLEVGDDWISSREINPWKFTNENGEAIYSQGPRYADRLPPNTFINTFKGRGYLRYVGKTGIFVPKPFDFTNKNGISLEDEQGILKAIIFPGSFPKNMGFHLNMKDYEFLWKYMSMYPRESKYPHYLEKSYPDNYVKFLLFGDDSARVIPKNIRIFNKIGQAYGFLIDNAYIVDFDQKIEFMLTVVINSNTMGIYNNDHYEYSKVGFPFLRSLGKLIYDYEKDRKKRYLPDLSHYKINYQDPD